MKKLNNCLKGKNYSGHPIWFMRQAGRYLPEFQTIRKKNPNFINLCLNEKLSTKLSLQPLNRFDLDAVIIFSDILIVLYGLGQNVKLKKNFGPILNNFVFDELINTSESDFIKKVFPVYNSIKNIKAKINYNNKSIIGFSGAPWTLLVYMMNKKTPKKNFNMNKIIKDKSLTNKLLNKIENIICLHVDKQIEAGADVIQIFDSWAGLLSKKDLPNYCYIPNLKIVDYIKSKKVPVICFPRGIGKNYKEFCSFVKPDCISIDHEIDPKWIKHKLKDIAIQGGLDPRVLLLDKEQIKKSVEKYLNIFKDRPYVFNLGHGILPNTNPEIINYIIEIVRNNNK